MSRRRRPYGAHMLPRVVIGMARPNELRAAPRSGANVEGAAALLQRRGFALGLTARGRETTTGLCRLKATPVEKVWFHVRHGAAWKRVESQRLHSAYTER